MQASVPDRQIDIFSLLSAEGRPELAFDELGRRPGRRIELSFATAAGEWSQRTRAVRIERSGGRRLLIYEVDGAGYGMIAEEQFDARLPYPVRAYAAAEE